MTPDALLGRTFALDVWIDFRTRVTPEIITVTGINPETRRYRVYRHATRTREDLTFQMFDELMSVNDIEEIAHGPAGA